MRIANQKWAITLGAALALIICVNVVRADKPPLIPALDDGELVYITVVNANVFDVKHEAITSKVANPIYFVDGQPHVLSIGLGEAGYNPYWDIVTVTVLNGRDVSTDPFLSEDEILDAEANGEVKVSDRHIILLCQVISK